MSNSSQWNTFQNIALLLKYILSVHEYAPEVNWLSADSYSWMQLLWSDNIFLGSYGTSLGSESFVVMFVDLVCMYVSFIDCKGLQKLEEYIIL